MFSGPLALAGLLSLVAVSVRAETIATRFPQPPGFVRLTPEAGSFGDFLRRHPLRPVGTPALLHDGSPKKRRDVVMAVLDLDVGRRDLQQCADTILRLRAEWLRSRGDEGALAFRFTSGHLSRWTEWAEGARPRVAGNRVTFERVAAPDRSDASFRAWLDSVFTYAGTLSLVRELQPARGPVEAGDVFVQGGSPGHAMIVVDVAERPGTSERRFLLAQGFMPAQDAHVVVRPGSPEDPWYAESDELETPEWTFRRGDRRRFAEPPSAEAR